MRLRDSKWLTPQRRRFWAILLTAAICVVMIVTLSWHFSDRRDSPRRPQKDSGNSGGQEEDDLIWRRLPWNNPLEKPRPLPTQGTKPLPAVQFKFGDETEDDKKTRLGRREAVKTTFQRCWASYIDQAWLHDELKPVSGGSKDTFGGWAATLVDALDTMWIMGMYNEFNEAVGAVDKNISFASSSSGDVISLFETNIRYLGGLVAAYDLSGEDRLKKKATDAGDMILKAFDTPNHMPVGRWNIKEAAENKNQTAPPSTSLAEIGTMVLEFTRLSLITGDARYYDVTQHITDLLDASQMTTKLPGLWSGSVDPSAARFDTGSIYSMGGGSDSAYEYFPKMMALLDHLDPMYERLYKRSMAATHKHLIYRPMVPGDADILMTGDATTRDAPEGQPNLSAVTEHLTCFAGGMYALGGRLTSNDSDVEIGRRLTDGCVWAYNATKSGVMPERLMGVPCYDKTHCTWNETAWRAAVGDSVRDDELPPKGIAKIVSKEYILRPEAIESVFIMYRITGDKMWQEKAWIMWQAVDGLTKTDLANSAVANVDTDDARKLDSMESFWLAETLKYFYLVFSEPSLISLDEWVLNTEAHPFKRLGTKS
ncbi:glycosyl hydrolase family 47 protein [Cordyceps fumosorosea ARSEF 2679]|uniref:alpha-1,2-Mannosidase n=1 Tax=Cordyceps fumosorosea (strain ARSEF 2679) TaxID=1081104 RepID=A0A168ARD0_CORFA|nr:glycosyl hydrolase family 47 protein [Cordyceps fumosorosea ARSEF 2679]OAA69090.1 glycosyl hydrolase family 47 protein [Cordyceps fumosorosea ARSEF 2679]